MYKPTFPLTKPWFSWWVDVWADDVESLLDYMDNVELENVEIFHLTETVYLNQTETEQIEVSPGWYWWICFPGCLPEGDGILTARGPFLSEQAARLDAYREQMESETV